MTANALSQRDNLMLPEEADIMEELPDIESRVVQAEVARLHAEVGLPAMNDVGSYAGPYGETLTDIVRSNLQRQADYDKEQQFAAYSLEARRKLARDDRAYMRRAAHWFNRAIFHVPYVGAASRAMGVDDNTSTTTLQKEAGVQFAGELTSAAAVFAGTTRLAYNILEDFYWDTYDTIRQIPVLEDMMFDMLYGQVGSSPGLMRFGLIVGGAFIGGKIVSSAYNLWRSAVPTSDERLEQLHESYDLAQQAVADVYTRGITEQLDAMDERREAILESNRSAQLEASFSKLEAEAERSSE